MTRYVDRYQIHHETMNYPEYCGRPTCGICSMGERGDEFAKFLNLEPFGGGSVLSVVDAKRQGL